MPKVHDSVSTRRIFTKLVKFSVPVRNCHKERVHAHHLSLRSSSAMADDALDDPYGFGPEDMLMDDAPDDAAEGLPLWEEAPQPNVMSNARRIGMYRDENPALMALSMRIICSWETGQPLEDPQAFDGNPAQLQDGGHEPGEKGAAYVEVRGATGAVATSVRKTNNVRMPRASPVS